MYATAEWGTAYESPVGTNTAQRPGQMFEYSALSIMASQNNTTVQIDADANGTYETTVTLNEGGSYPGYRHPPGCAQSVLVATSRSRLCW